MRMGSIDQLNFPPLGDAPTISAMPYSQNRHCCSHAPPARLAPVSLSVLIEVVLLPTASAEARARVSDETRSSSIVVELYEIEIHLAY